VPDNITFISGRLDDAAFRELYVNAKVVVLPLTPVVSAGGITSLFEAMAMGKPVVLSRSSISDDFITHQHDGLIVEPHDAQALSQAIHQLTSDREARLRLGTNARHRIETQCSTRQLAVNIRQFIEQMAR
jgi:glycosyltransferase involved in cell wall biosynthesis